MIKVYVNLMFRRTRHENIMQMNIAQGLAVINELNFSAWKLQLIEL